jgi:hypothetical protein
VSSTTIPDNGEIACEPPVKELLVFIWQKALGTRAIPDAVEATKYTGIFRSETKVPTPSST